MLREARGRRPRQSQHTPRLDFDFSARISDGRKRPAFDPYEGYTGAQREFTEELDLWTLEEVIVRVMTEIDRRRRLYLGGHAKMLERRNARVKGALDAG
jgi:hypothetical protein